MDIDLTYGERVMVRLKGILDKYGLTKSKAVMDAVRGTEPCDKCGEESKEEPCKCEGPTGVAGVTAGPTGFIGPTGVIGKGVTVPSGYWYDPSAVGATGAPGPAMTPTCSSAITTARTMDSRVTTIGVRNAEVIVDAATEGPPPEEEFEVICKSTDGLAGVFDVGERYMAKRVEPFLTRIMVLDTYGRWIKCDVECFEATGD